MKYQKIIIKYQKITMKIPKNHYYENYYEIDNNFLGIFIVIFWYFHIIFIIIFWYFLKKLSPAWPLLLLKRFR